MADDNALALQIRANPPDIGAPLTQAAQIGYLGEHQRQMAIANDFAQQLNAARLGLYNGTDDGGQPGMGGGGSGMGPGGPGGGGILSPRRIERFSALDPAGAEKMAKTGQTLQDTAQSGDTYKRSWLAQKAQAYQALNDPGAKKAFWNDAIIEGYNKGYLTPLQASNLHGAPNDKMVDAIVAQSMAPKDYAETSGAKAANEAAAKFPFENRLAANKAGFEGTQTRLNQTHAAGFDTVEVRDTQSGQTYNVPRSQIPALTGTAAGSGAPPGGTVPPPNLPFGLSAGRGAGVLPAPGTQPAPAASVAQAPAAGLAQPVPGTGVLGLPGKLALSPEQEDTSKAFGDQNKQIIANEAKVDKILQDTRILRSVAKEAFRPGATGEERSKMASYILDAMQSAGMTPPDVIKEAATGANVIDKIGGKMTTDIVQSLGTREALGIYNNVGRYMPNLKMSEGGFDAIVNSIEQGALRDKDLAAFRRQWLAPKTAGNEIGGHASIDGMLPEFDKAHPRDVYASHVWPLPMPKSPADALVGAIYKNPRGGADKIWNGEHFVIPEKWQR